MARILPDREIRGLIDTVLIGADDQYINPNGIELRLGKPSALILLERGKSLALAFSLKLIQVRV